MRPCVRPALRRRAACCRIPRVIKDGASCQPGRPAPFFSVHLNPGSFSVYSRRQAREWAVQLVFEFAANPDQAKSTEQLFQTFWEGGLRLRPEGEAREALPDDAARRFAETLFRAWVEHRDEVDEAISKRLRNWTLDRVGSEERAVMRVAATELLFLSGDDRAPDPVIINEAVDLAKYFGSNESGRFVNGILDAIARRRRAAKARELEKSEIWTPGQSPTGPSAK